MRRNSANVILATFLILGAAGLRVVFNEAHLWNLAPIAALGLFSGAIFKDKRYAFLLPLLAQFGGDLYFHLFTATPGFYDLSQFFTYGALAVATLMGFRLKSFNALNILGFTLGASTVFFLISNFGVWLQGWYGTGFSALVKTYLLAIPFYKATIIGDLAGSIALFSIYSLVNRTAASRLQKA